MAEEAEKVVATFQDDEWSELAGEDEDVEVQFLTERELAEKEAKETPKKPEVDELLKRIEQLEAEKTELVPRANEVQAMKSAVDSLGTALKAPAPAPTPAAQEDWSTLNSKFSEGIMGDQPLAALNDAVKKLVGSDMKTLGEGLVQLRGMVMSINPKWGSVYQKYQDEIDSAVNARADKYTNLNAYVEETERMAARHIEDIIDERLTAREAEREKEKPAPRRREFTEAGRTQNPTPVRQKVYKVTEADEKIRIGKGMTREAYYAAKERRNG